jgi:peptide/nickel transport system substrate-binding protein
VLEAWESNEDGSVWTLTIRKGVLDELGREMKAADFVWNWDKTIQMGPCSYISNGINLKSTDQIEVIDDYTVKMDLGAPNPIFLRVLHVNNGMAIAPSVQDYDTPDDPWAGDWLKTNVVALGPYRIDAFVPGEQVRLEKNPNWFGPEPDIDTVIYRQVPESANRVALLMSGDAHIARDLTQDELDEIAKVDGLTAQCTAANQFLYAAMNHLDGPTADVNVRQALAYATPYQDIIESAYRGRAGAMPGFHPPTYSDYLGEDAWPYETDYDKARELLAAAGYADGFAANIVVDSGVPEHETVAVLLQSSFAEIGVELQIDMKPTAAHRDVAFGRTFGDMVLDQNYAITLDPGYHAGVWLPDLEGGFNFGGFYDEEFHTTLDTGFQTAVGPERTEMMYTLQKVFNDQSVYLSLATVPTCFGMSDKVQNYVWHTHNQIVFSDLTLEE